MSCTDAVRTCFSKYIVCSGRANRPEYWWFVLFVMLVNGVLSIADPVVFGTNSETLERARLFSALFGVAIFLPMLAAGWRCLHDTGRPGWYYLVHFALSLATFVMLLSGVVVFGALGGGVEDAASLLGSAAFLGTDGLLLMGVAQLVTSLLLLWWLTRPFQEGNNVYG